MIAFVAMVAVPTASNRIQRIQDLKAATVEASVAGFLPAARTGRSRTNVATTGTPMASTTRPSTRQACRQPTPRRRASVDGGCVIDATAPPAMTIESARPRRTSNHVETAREYASAEVPMPATPITAKTTYICASDEVNADSDAMPAPQSATHGTA